MKKLTTRTNGLDLKIPSTQPPNTPKSTLPITNGMKGRTPQAKVQLIKKYYLINKVKKTKTQHRAHEFGNYQFKCVNDNGNVFYSYQFIYY